MERMCYMMDMERFAGRYRQLQRATVARSALDVISIIFLFAGFAFWLVFFWMLLAPPALLSLLMVMVIVLALAYALGTPLLLSMLVPTTPAGQLLQKTQWATVGFYVILGAALYLLFKTEQLIEAWAMAQPGIAENGMERTLAFTLTIAFVVIPALAWVQLTPERWAAMVTQAHQVKKLEMTQKGELAILKASILSAERKALKGWANLLPLEQQEVFHTMRGLLMATSDTQREIVRTLGLGAELERDIMDDHEIADRLDYVAQRLDVLPDIGGVEVPQLPRESTTANVDMPPAAARAAERAHVDSRPQSSETRAHVSDSDRQRPTVSDPVARRIAAELPRIFTAQNLADLVQQDKRTAQRTIATWLDEGMIVQVQLGRYSLTDREAR
jgi:hypothetical protein